RASSMSITMPGIMPDSAQPPLRLISRWKYDPASDSFHIGRGYSFTILDGLNIILKFCMGRLEATSLCWLAYGDGACAF
ncbi:MAG: hypothetical protein OEW14_04335, partial [Nitrospira sp.]|nr:hypothetical protein [Nitrospira sp.]